MNSRGRLNTSMARPGNESSRGREMRAAPHVYRPLHLPRVLQPALAAAKSLRPPALPTKTVAPPRVLLRSAPLQAQVGAKLRSVPPVMKPPQPARMNLMASRPQTVQRFSSRIVQATKFYPNLHPGAVEPVDSSNIFRLNSFADQYRLHKVNSHGVNVPNQQYNFVRTREGDMLLHARYRHPSIAQGKQVLYAGEIFFNNGRLQWWSNGSGHYQPDSDNAVQASLPMDYFYSYQQIIKGEHTRKKS